ncbi:hypothetical protein [Pseudomonas protegens]|uniref:Uncharacterized protein n=1 Tax=Pseudomonas protegens (strain DSM 19095 / LMG 27888 / CFBP 6595 / CHA0) TaxID=1124983 RepID=A0A2C9EJK1_PSEPH|nr:hypothetical protein [Pseudomonas protegens]AGL83840.1 hypothetical protein PFLCHA0_c20590 [Pseudomonas protegens CHA0]MBP5108662.1 hypothetical protein [Pseudomonas protegens]QTU24686.1 hypothetical protein HUT21_10150 [Pseudomonas protegens]QTU34215.1 hypothetical protein HUT20_28055 [Pseudomonas protegens]RLO20584.1 hypothetical protein EAG75_26965 [Pseudomonas protegens]
MTAKIAYLEISGRLTGKTTRLVKIANDLTTQGKTVIFVTRQTKDLRGRLPGVVVLSDRQAPPDDVNQERAIWIYDEFDWLKSTKVRNGGYYATTASRIRDLRVDTPETDLLLQLIELNGGSYQRHLLIPGVIDEAYYEEARAAYTDEQYRQLILGEFLK